ncbi:hypothetical protein B1H38_07535 [Leptospira borgpetersenii serovar Ballum]|nr:hypothetical protein B1H38_07535 [Leptospira borgpetersenii serovar Ballum]
MEDLSEFRRIYPHIQVVAGSTMIESVYFELREQDALNSIKRQKVRRSNFTKRKDSPRIPFIIYIYWNLKSNQLNLQKI